MRYRESGEGDGDCRHQGVPLVSMRWTHFTDQNPCRPGATILAGRPPR
jgi:hypothetical protein